MRQLVRGAASLESSLALPSIKNKSVTKRGSIENPLHDIPRSLLLPPVVQPGRSRLYSRRRFPCGSLGLSLSRVELWVVVHDRLVEFGRAFERCALRTWNCGTRVSAGPWSAIACSGSRINHEIPLENPDYWLS
jgi:hypothetical protein